MNAHPVCKLILCGYILKWIYSRLLRIISASPILHQRHWACIPSTIFFSFPLFRSSIFYLSNPFLTNLFARFFFSSPVFMSSFVISATLRSYYLSYLNSLNQLMATGHMFFWYIESICDRFLGGCASI